MGRDFGDQVFELTTSQNLNGENAINPTTTESVKNQLNRNGNSLLDEARVHFQQDGAPSQYVLPF